MTVSILPSAVVTEMAKREHRMQHFLWHGVRNSWERMTLKQKQDIRNIDPAWEPPRPALNVNGNVERDNNSGEDFLYMHRQMVAHVNAILAQIKDPNYPKIEGWKNVPLPGDIDYPVPALPGLESVKSDEFYTNTMLPWEKKYTDPSYLKSVSLGQFGADLEFTIHNNMHMRWAAPSQVGYRPSTALTKPVDVKWDDLAYNYLGDTYSSHVNPIFWKLHGWVDARIEDWTKANGVTGPIQWKGTWEGPMDHSHHHQHRAMTALIPSQTSKNKMDKLEALAQVIADAIVFDGFFKPAQTQSFAQVP